MPASACAPDLPAASGCALPMDMLSGLGASCTHDRCTLEQKSFKSYSKLHTFETGCALSIGERIAQVAWHLLPSVGSYVPGLNWDVSYTFNTKRQDHTVLQTLLHV